MRQYRPTIEELKKRYSMELARKRMARLRREKRPPDYKEARIPDNSEPWLPHPPRSVAECAWINEQITNSIEEWKRQNPRFFSSTS
jgi:hypothetical protein